MPPRRIGGSARPAILVLLGVALTLAPSPARAAWPTTPDPNVPVESDSTRSAFSTHAVPDSCGGAIIAWSTDQPAGTIQVQRMDVAGQARWTKDGVNVNPPSPSGVTFDIASDAAGGAYVVWSTGPSGNADIFVQHVLASGVLDPAWPPGGVPVCVAPGDQVYPVIAPDGSGGALMAWEDSRGNVDQAPDIYAQRVNVGGAPLWAPNGVPVIAANAAQYSPAIASDGAGGLYAAWTDRRADGGDVYAQHLDAGTGARLWPPLGVGVGVASNTQYGPQVVSGVGRMLVVWSDSRAPVFAIYAQAVSFAGAVAWPANGVQVSGPLDPNNNTPTPVSDGLGGVIVGWQAFDSGGSVDDIHAQRVDPGGSLAWGPNGVVLCAAAGRQLFMAGTSDQRGGAIFGWDDRRVSESAIDVYARRVDSGGNVLWAGDGAVVSNRYGNQVAPAITTDGAGGAILAWQDYHTPNTLVYAQQIGAGGQLGVRAPSSGCKPDLCGYAYTDFGDAPEGGIAFPSGAPGHYPTCLTDGAPGTQEIQCGSALSPPPGPTGYVKHVAGWSDPSYFGLGCGPPNALQLAVDSELDGIVGASGSPTLVGTASLCSPSATVQDEETAFGGLWFAADEKPGDADAGLAYSPVFAACATNKLIFEAWLCASSPLTVRLNVLADWSQDGDWNDVVACGSGATATCAPEWAVKNAPILLQPGCNTILTPGFTAGPSTGPSWLRLTLTADPVPDDFPWAGSEHVPGPQPGVPGGTFAGGETEDYPVAIVSSTAVASTPSALDGLAPIAPNPARGPSRVQFGLPERGPARLAVYDLAGRQVRLLADGFRAAGPHDVTWDGRDDDGAPVRPGVYFVHLTWAGRSQSRALVRLE
jgi:hypothetical protein